MSKRDKTPKVKAEPPGKGPRPGGNPDDTNGLTPVWSIGIFDREGPWGQERCSQENAIWEHIFPGLRQYELMTWAAIYADRHRNHSVAISKLIRSARNRLEELGMDDLDELFRFRLTGTQRVWGIRDGRVFRLLWWDPGHEVCPSQLRNT